MPTWIQKIYSSVTGKGAPMAKVPFISAFANRLGFGTYSMARRDYLTQYKNWVYACVTARSEEVGNIQLKLMQNGEEVKKSPLIDLLNKVNPYMTSHDLFLATQAFKDLDGNAFWYLAKTEQGEIAEIYLLRPDRVILVPSKENPLTVEGYVYTQPDGQRIPLPADSVIHFKNFNPLGNHPFPHRGMGVVEAAAWAIDTDNETRSWNLNFFRNSARPDGVLTTAGESSMDASEYKRLEEEWNAKHQGSDNSHRVAILSGGMTWTEIARSQKEMDFMEQRVFGRDEILSMFRVPKAIVGITDDVNRASADATVYVFALRTIKPLMQQMVDTLNEFLVPAFGENLELEFASPVTEDRRASIDEYTLGINSGWLSPNEVREIEGLPPVEGGDNLFLPFNLAPIGTIAQADPRTDNPAPTSNGLKAVERFVNKRNARKAITASAVRSLTTEAKAKYLELWKATMVINTRPLEKTLRTFFTAQQDEVLKNIRNQGKAADDFLFDEEDAVATSITFITPYIREYIKRSGKNASQLVGLDTFDAETPTLKAFVAERARYFAKEMNKTTSEALLKSINEGIANSESLSEIEERVAKVYSIAKGSRTQMIARTESSAASNVGAIGAYSQAGVEEIEWRVVNPEDEDCIENEGVTVKIGQAFPSGDSYPPVHPNCVCTTLPVFN